jgi:8-oxo-dGTP pyrophosphatase MutT (NUDIX family)
MSFDVPQGRILAVDEIDLHLSPDPHPYEVDRAPDIEANWQHELRGNAALFDGQVMLLSSLEWRSGLLRGTCHLVRFATFMLWRRERPLMLAQHLFANAIPVTSDGKLMLIRMGPDTANAGRVYFASGSFEDADFRAGRLDVASNVQREVYEETGLDLTNTLHEPKWHMLWRETGSVIFRRHAVARSSADIEAEVRDYIGDGAGQEIDDVHFIASHEDLPPTVAGHVPDLVRWHIATPFIRDAAR